MVRDKKTAEQMGYVLMVKGDKMNADKALDGLLDGLVTSKLRPMVAQADQVS